MCVAAIKDALRRKISIYSCKQILDTFQPAAAPTQAEDLAEARLMESIVHPNIMQTYQHATRLKAECSPNAKMSYDIALNNQSGILLETWLLLEFCNKGSLQV